MQDEILIEDPKIEEYLQRDVEESIRQGSIKPFIEEAVLQVSEWGFSLADLQVQKQCQQRGFLRLFRSMYSEAECVLTGFLGQIHIWQVGAKAEIPNQGHRFNLIHNAFINTTWLLY